MDTELIVLDFNHNAEHIVAAIDRRAMANILGRGKRHFCPAKNPEPSASSAHDSLGVYSRAVGSPNHHQLVHDFVLISTSLGPGQ